MKRLRTLLVVIAVALGVPVALLAWRALDGLAAEQAVRQQTVAERAFDEMERQLTSFLEVEERRPFDDYAGRLPDGRVAYLTEPLEWPFVVGAFQVEPDGSLTVPLGESHAPAVQTVRRVVALAFEANDKNEGRQESQAKAKREQAPGTTRALAGRLVGQERSDDEGMDLDGASETAYDLLQGLNRAAGERRRKVAEAKKQNYKDVAPSAPAPQRATPSAGYFAEESFRESELRDDAGALELEVLESSELRALGYAVPSKGSGGKPAELAAAAEPAPLAEAIAIGPSFDPMLGREAGEGHILLYRTVLRARQGYRQGLVIDTAALGAWLEREVVLASGLGSVASVIFGTSFAEANGSQGTFQHRFAEPFDTLSARMQLAGLPGSSGPQAVHALVVLLVLVGAAGLFAIHRMVSVVVHFAERRNNFVAAVTHELKTPLTAIRMYGEMLRDGMVRDEAKRDEYYGTITDESERLSRLIDNVLEFSRLERDTRSMDWVVGAPGPVLEDVAERLAAHAARQGFEIETAVEDGLPAVRFDRDALVQVLFNLVDNAMKYARSADERRVVLEARRSDDGVSVSVRDFGPGVQSGHLARIFEPFYRAEDEMTRTTKGTGIGLALVKDLVERMGAAVSGGNASGGGFRVEINFEAARA
jgi:signal transduction histidine kinase